MDFSLDVKFLRLYWNLVPLLLIGLFFNGFTVNASVNLRFNQYTPCNDMEIQYESNSDVYTFHTIGSDPYIFVAPLSRNLKSDENILSFEYKCDSLINYIKIYYGQFCTEKKSSVYQGLESNDQWKKVSIDLTSDKNIFVWGRKSDVIRIDFGDFAGVTFSIRKMRIHADTDVDSWQEDKKPTFTNLVNTGLPLFDIVTLENEEPTCDYVHAPEGAMGSSITNETKVLGKLRVFKSDSLYPIYESKNNGITIKIRGNTSAVFCRKKPYKIKLSKEADLLFRDDNNVGMDKNWVLLRDDSLKTLAGFQLNRLLGLEWTPSMKYINLMINGNYKGVYALVESVERNQHGRINVSAGGFIFEQDTYWWNEDFYINNTLEPNLGYTIKYPNFEDLLSWEIDYLETLITNYENSILDGTYSDYIDVESFALWILGHDIFGSYDSAGTNLYLSKYDTTSNSKIKLTNLWDFDCEMMCGNNWSRNHTITQCFKHLFNSKNSYFRDVYYEKWNQLRDTIFKSIPIFLDSFLLSEEGKGLNKSIEYDNYLWGISNQSVEKSIQRIMQWFQNREIWLADNIKNDNSTRSLDFPNEQVLVYCKDSYIYIKKFDTDMVSVYSILGERIYVGFDDVIYINKTGYYLVQVGNKYCKVVVR